MQSANPRPTLRRRTVHYSGRVQGVGFRQTVRRLAEGCAVTGFVQNLADGRVLLAAEGTDEELDRFLQRIAAALAENIQAIDVETGPAERNFESFDIRFGP